MTPAIELFIATWAHRPDILAQFEKLPPMCYTVHTITGDTVIIAKGENGFHDPEYGHQGEEAVNRMNDRMGVSRAQRSAMEAGSICGYQLPLANPDIYDALGQYIATGSEPKSRHIKTRLRG